METSLAIYEALIQANVPQPAARRVAESLEKDMSSNLATKQDLQQLEQQITGRFNAMEVRFSVVDARFDAVDARFTTVDVRFKELEERISLKMENLESRIVIKLGALMTFLIGAASGVQALLR